jgi:release factor glutamine methyltransferase
VFAERGFENPRLEAELLLAGILGIRRLDLYLQHERPVAPAELDRFRSAVRRRLRHEPLQYVLGTASFRQLELLVDARALIPRPETEQLVGAVLEWCRAPGRQATSVVDIGTGTGAIALSLAAEGSFERVVATDVSQDALQLAAENARRTGHHDVVEFRHGSMFDPLHGGETFSAIVSNPPYVAESERVLLAPEVREHEPAGALFAGADGLAAIETLVSGAPAWLEPGGLLALEIGAGQAQAVLDRVRSCGRYRAERVMNDMTGRPRMMLAEYAPELQS